jgi:hypothetical protein
LGLRIFIKDDSLARLQIIIMQIVGIFNPNYQAGSFVHLIKVVDIRKDGGKGSFGHCIDSKLLPHDAIRIAAEALQAVEKDKVTTQAEK